MFNKLNRFVEMLNKLQTDFSSQFSDVKLHEKSLRLFKNLFNIDENDVNISFQLELIESKSNFRQALDYHELIEFWLL